jgi:hypothetical protein
MGERMELVAVSIYPSSPRNPPLAGPSTSAPALDPPELIVHVDKGLFQRPVARNTLLQLLGQCSEQVVL